MVSKYLSWSKQPQNVATKRNRALGFLKRNVKVQSRTMKEKACKALIQLTLEHASTEKTEVI